jgi:hypothetical protein
MEPPLSGKSIAEIFVPTRWNLDQRVREGTTPFEGTLVDTGWPLFGVDKWCGVGCGEPP